jgi:hypothetical protein
VQAVALRPGSPQLWTAILHLKKPIPENVVAEATKIAGDPKATLALRLATAAVAGANGDKPAAKFLWEQETAVCAEYSKMDIGTLLSIGYAHDKESRDRWRAFSIGESSIGLLAWLPDPKVRTQMLELLAAKNPPIRQTAEIVLARKWPDDLLRVPKQQFGTDEEYTYALAALAIYHPELMPAVEKAIPAVELRAAIAQIKHVQGITGIFALLGVDDEGD